MANQFQKFLAVIEALNKFEVEYVLVGGVAVILHGLERLTRDIDIFVEDSATNIDRLKMALRSLYDDPEIDEITLDELRNYAVIRYGTPDGFYIDIMTRLGETFSFQDLEYETIEFGQIKIKIATPETLFKMKQNTLRLQDKADALFLQEIIQQRKSDQ
ncbi:MAG: nucleotidyl transferase AbiEii/AbiGii toxin family protein [candidate division KSB1 bacterium]|nr:nucleotidyl transferase AbiEii/AbiGii toxin family protein [candidate division KSB1 bacterium]